jgi:import inner membrane translocase subunit TIM50
LAKAQAWLLERYLAVARPLDAKVREYADPPCDNLLPDLPPEHRGRVKTLVVDLEGVLTHKSWSRGRGWTVYKRPGASEFLQAAAQYYEVVVYTSEPNMYADPVINRLDPNRTAVAYRLYRQDTQYTPGGEHVRDLSKLNRDLSQVLLLACDSSAWAFQPDNALKLRPWRGPDEGGEGGEAAAAAAAAEPKKKAKPDTTLLDLIPFLQMVATKGVADVRDVVRAYDGEPDVAAAFRRRMARLAARKQGAGAAAAAARAAHS